MNEYRSAYEILIEKLKQNNQIEELSGEDNLLIMKELNEGMSDFVNEQRAKEKSSELELAGIVLTS